MTSMPVANKPITLPSVDADAAEIRVVDADADAAEQRAVEHLGRLVDACFRAIGGADLSDSWDAVHNFIIGHSASGSTMQIIMRRTLPDGTVERKQFIALFAYDTVLDCRVDQVERTPTQ